MLPLTGRPRLSVVTRVRNRVKHLRASLPWMLGQTYDSLEIVVVDYGSTDGLHEMLWAEFRPFLLSGIVVEVRVKDVPKFIPTHAQNVGIRHASGEWLAFIDCDTILKPFFFEHVMSKICGMEGIFARPIPEHMHADQAGQMICRKADIEEIGGFNEDLVYGWGYDDGDIRDRLILKGLELFLYDSSISVPIEHEEKDRTGELTDQNRRKSHRSNEFVSRETRVYHGTLANIGKEWGAGGIRVNERTTAMPDNTPLPPQPTEWKVWAENKQKMQLVSESQAFVVVSQKTGMKTGFAVFSSAKASPETLYSMFLAFERHLQDLGVLPANPKPQPTVSDVPILRTEIVKGG